MDLYDLKLLPALKDYQGRLSIVWGDGYRAWVQRAEPLYTHESLTVLQSRYKFDNAKARQDLGYAPRPLADTLRDTYAWFEAAGMLRRAA